MAAARLAILLLYSSEYSDCFVELYSKKKHTLLRIKLLLYHDNVNISFLRSLDCFFKTAYVCEISIHKRGGGAYSVTMTSFFKDWVRCAPNPMQAFPEPKPKTLAQISNLVLKMFFFEAKMNRDMKFPTMWYVPSAKPQISLRIRAVSSEPLLVA